MIRLYHGTTNEAYCNIMKYGFRHKEVVWTCSDPNMLYFYSDELIAKEFELDKQEAMNKSIEMALESAAFSAAVTNSASNDLFVFEFLIEDIYRNIIKKDHSMRDSAVCSVCIDTNLLNKLTYNVYHAPEHYTSRLSLFYISMLEQDFLPNLNISSFEKGVIENVIPLSLDLFQSELFDFFSELNITLIHENVCIDDINSFKYLDQKGQGNQTGNERIKIDGREKQEDDKVCISYEIKSGI